MPATANPIWKGTNNFISFLTPDNDVKVDDPVKFIARNEEIVVMMKNQDSFSVRLCPEEFNRKSQRNTNVPE
jgi:hypothetical protein